MLLISVKHIYRTFTVLKDSVSLCGKLHGYQARADIAKFFTFHNCQFSKEDIYVYIIYVYMNICIVNAFSTLS